MILYETSFVTPSLLHPSSRDLKSKRDLIVRNSSMDLTNYSTASQDYHRNQLSTVPAGNDIKWHQYRIMRFGSPDTEMKDRAIQGDSGNLLTDSHSEVRSDTWVLDTRPKLISPLSQLPGSHASENMPRCAVHS